MTAEALYAQLKELADTEPSFEASTPELARWLGRLYDAVERSGARNELIGLKLASDNVVGILNSNYAPQIRNVLYRTLARVERELPEAAQGGFIAAGDVFDALTVMGSALEKARARVLFVDPYMGPEALSKFALMVPEGVQVDLLGGKGRAKPSLEPAALAWVEQYAGKRPLRVRLADPALLHDRLMLVDDGEAWDVSQSLNALATRSPATISKSKPEHAAMKIEAYAPLFDRAEPLI